MVAAVVAVVVAKDGDLAKAIPGEAANRKNNIFIHHKVTQKLAPFFRVTK